MQPTTTTLSDGIFKIFIAGPDHVMYMMTRRREGDRITLARCIPNPNESFTLWPIRADVFTAEDAIAVAEEDASARAAADPEVRARKVAA